MSIYVLGTLDNHRHLMIICRDMLIAKLSVFSDYLLTHRSLLLPSHEGNISSLYQGYNKSKHQILESGWAM